MVTWCCDSTNQGPIDGFGDVLAEDHRRGSITMTPMIVASLMCPLRHRNM